MRAHYVLLAVLLPLATNTALAQDRLQSSDLLKLRSVSGVEVSPDATRVAYTVENNDGTGRPYGQLWVMTLADGKTIALRRREGAVGQPELVARQPVDRVSAAASATKPVSRLRTPTAAARASSRR